MHAHMSKVAPKLTLIRSNIEKKEHEFRHGTVSNELLGAEIDFKCLT